jgi:hypothetical protein
MGFAFFLEKNQIFGTCAVNLVGLASPIHKLFVGWQMVLAKSALLETLALFEKTWKKCNFFFCNFTHFSTKVLHNMQYHPAIAIFSNLVVSWATLFDLFVFFCAKCSGGKIRSSWMDKRTWILLYDSEESTDLVLAEKMNKQ